MFHEQIPVECRRLVLLGSFSNFNKPVIAEFKQVLNELKDPVDSLFALEFQKSTIVNPIPEEMLKKFVDESLKLPAYVWKGVAAGWSKSEFVNDLKNFNKPTLIIWGNKDAYCPLTDQEELHKSIKNSKLLVYDGIGHATHWEAPERFANDFVKFISDLKQ